MRPSVRNIAVAGLCDLPGLSLIVAAAKALGYLIGPYDTVENIQEPKTADAVSSIWPPELYPSGCVIDEHGERVRGFAGRGRELSSQALELAEPKKHYLADRVGSHERTGIICALRRGGSKNLEKNCSAPTVECRFSVRVWTCSAHRAPMSLPLPSVPIEGPEV